MNAVLPLTRRLINSYPPPYASRNFSKKKLNRNQRKQRDRDMTEAFIRKKQAKSKFLAFGKRKLHPAAKMKRILSYSDHYFSYDNLKKDDFLLTELDANDDWVRISVLMTFPKILELIDPEKEANVVVDAFNSQKRFEVKGGEDPPTALVRKVKNRKPSVDIENNFPFHSPVEDSPHPTPKPKKINLPKNLPKYALPDTCEVVGEFFIPSPLDLMKTRILAINQHPRNEYRHNGYIHY